MKTNTKIKLFLKFTGLILIALFCKGVAEANYPKPKTEVKKTEVAEPPSDNYPKIIGLIEAQTEDLYIKYFGEDANIARAICKAENQGENPNAVNKNKNGSLDQGLCQINTVNKKHYQGEDIFNPEVNVKTAKKVYDSQGWFAWTVYKNGSFRKYLDK